MRTCAVGIGYLALAIIMGALVAHSLKTRLDEYSLGVFYTGQQYQVYAALATTLLGIVSSSASKPNLNRPVAVLMAGSLIFSGSLYALALSGVRLWGAVTPLGGVLMIGSLLWTAVRLWRTDTHA